MKRRMITTAVVMAMTAGLLCSCRDASGEPRETTLPETSFENTITTEATTEPPTTEAPPTEEETTTAAPSVEERRTLALRNETQPSMWFYNRHDAYVEFTPEPSQTYGYWSDFSHYVDICLYTCFPSNERENIGYGEFRDCFRSWWAAYADANGTRIGYELIIGLRDEEPKIVTITKPSDTQECFSPIEIYLYDDVNHAYGEWYSHLTELSEATFISGIKLTPGQNVDRVTDLTLTVFTYRDQADFDEETGRYVGGNYQTIHINNTNEN